MRPCSSFVGSSPSLVVAVGGVLVCNYFHDSAEAKYVVAKNLVKKGRSTRKDESQM